MQDHWTLLHVIRLIVWQKHVQFYFRLGQPLVWLRSSAPQRRKAVNVACDVLPMAISGANDAVQPSEMTPIAKASDVASLLRQLGSTQHLDRERSRLKLLASLRDTGLSFSPARSFSAPKLRCKSEGCISSCCRGCPGHYLGAA